jgi:hypothetical protein
LIRGAVRSELGVRKSDAEEKRIAIGTTERVTEDLQLLADGRYTVEALAKAR